MTSYSQLDLFGDVDTEISERNSYQCAIRLFLIICAALAKLAEVYGIRVHLVRFKKNSIIQIWTIVECSGVIYCTVVTSYCPRPKLLLKPSYFPRAFRPEGNMRVEGVIFGRWQYDVSTVQ